MFKRRAIAVGLALATITCSRSEPPPWDGPTLSAPRAQLTVDQLLDDELPPLLDMSFFAEPAWAESDATAFEGVLSLSGAALDMDFPESRDLYAGEDQFPAIDIALASHNGQLIPMQRDLRTTSDDDLWEVMVGTGAVWQEADDGDWSRASIPMNLVERYFNQVRNCVATFVYQADVVSDVYVQCSQETADLADQQVGNLRTIVPATYTPTVFPDRTAVIDAHERIRASRLPMRPLADWDTDGEITAYLDKAIWTNASTSVGAVYVDGTLYVHPAMTRHGPYPYPREMRHGVYSATKSLAGGLAMFYFAERYGEEVFDAKIADYVPALADLPEWQGATFSDALNMSTGTRGGEEPALLFEPLVTADSAEQAITNIAALGDAPEAPGEVFSYATTNTFVLSFALQSYVNEQEGSHVPYWDLVRENVLVPIGAEHLELLFTRDEDPSTRIPLLGFGARPTLDEAAKIALLISNEGVHGDEQLLHGGKIREALGRTDWEGLRVNGKIRYRHSFWSQSIRTRGLSRGCSTPGPNSCRAEVSYMQGYGANHILLLESGVIVFRFMDESDDDIADLVQRVERIQPSCE